MLIIKSMNLITLHFWTYLAFKDVCTNCFCTSLLRTVRKFTCYVMHRACTPSTKMNNARADGHCYSSAWIECSWTFGDPHFSFQKQILFTIISTLLKNEQKIIMES